MLIRSIYARDPSIAAVLTYRGNYHGHPYQGLDPIVDASLIAAITDHFEKLGDPQGRHWQWPLDLAGRGATSGRVMSRPVSSTALESCS